MKQSSGGKPIGKCKGCCLNMRTFCAAGLDPKLVWAQGYCKERNNYSVLQNYLHAVGPAGSTGAKSRRIAAVKMKTAPHYNEIVFLSGLYSGNDFSHE